MMPNLLPTIIIATGGFLLLTQKDTRLALGAFFLQWAGIGWLVWISPSAGAGSLVALVEFVAALSTCVVIALTIFRTASPDDQTYPPASITRPAVRRRTRRSRTFQPQDWILLWGLALLAGVAGYGLARINPFGINEGDLLAFFWVVLTAVLVLTVDGGRSAVKLGLGILSLFNGAFLLLYVMGNSTPPGVVLALGALARIGAGTLASYLWLTVGERYDTLNLNAIFDARDGIIPRSTELVVVAPVDQPAAEEADLTDFEAEPAPEDVEDE